MRVGVIARGEDRGLGIQTWEVCRHIGPAAVLLVELTAELARGFPVHADRFPGALRVGHDGHRFDDVDLVQDFIRSVDVIYTAETVYDWRLCEWARAAGTAVVIQTNPELHRNAADRDTMEPTYWWNPTDWHMDLLADETVSPVLEVPMPVALDRFAGEKFRHDSARFMDRIEAHEGRPTFLHVGGHPATADRNGTMIVSRMLRRAREGQRWRVYTQDPRGFRRPTSHPAVLECLEPPADYWDLYVDADVLVMPRKFGGLCLPVQEAMAAGLAVVMTSTSPNERWPTFGIEPSHRGKMNRRGIVAVTPNYHEAARTVNDIDRDPSGMITPMADAAVAWAERNSWTTLLPVWRRRLEEAIDRVGQWQRDPRLP